MRNIVVSAVHVHYDLSASKHTRIILEIRRSRRAGGHHLTVHRVSHHWWFIHWWIVVSLSLLCLLPCRCNSTLARVHRLPIKDILCMQLDCVIVKSSNWINMLFVTCMRMHTLSTTFFPFLTICRDQVCILHPCLEVGDVPILHLPCCTPHLVSNGLSNHWQNSAIMYYSSGSQFNIAITVA